MNGLYMAQYPYPKLPHKCADLWNLYDVPAAAPIMGWQFIRETRHCHRYCPTIQEALESYDSTLLVQVEMWGIVDHRYDHPVNQLYPEHVRTLAVIDVAHELHTLALWKAEDLIASLRRDGFPLDPRLSQAVEIKRQWMRGQISDQDMEAATYQAKVAVAKHRTHDSALGILHSNQIRWIAELTYFHPESHFDGNLLSALFMMKGFA